jgi:Ni/Co efflux regulator RcnB
MFYHHTTSGPTGGGGTSPHVHYHVTTSPSGGNGLSGSVGPMHYSGGAPHYERDEHGYGRRPDYWNDRPRDFDRGSYQRVVYIHHPFSYGVYRRPHGWYYRRWGYGDTLPSFFWVRDFWIDSWWMFDLPIPPYGYEWIRYGDDALLVNVETGEVLQVQYGLFD